MSLTKTKRPINISQSTSSTQSVPTVPQPIRKDGKFRALQSYAHIRDLLNNGNKLAGKDLATYWKLQSSKLKCNLKLSIYNLCN
jgi:hypothetical protein